MRVHRLAFTRYCFTLNLYCGSQSSFHSPPYLQSLPFCNTIARPLRNIRPDPDPPLVSHTPYNVGRDYGVKAHERSAFKPLAFWGPSEGFFLID